MKGPVFRERRHQGPAFRGFRRIQKSQGDGPDIHGHHVSEQEQLKDRGHKKQRSVFFVPEKLDEFLPHQLSDPKKRHLHALPFQQNKGDQGEEEEHGEKHGKIKPEKIETDIPEVDAV
jgi:hypothetical protein